MLINLLISCFFVFFRFWVLFFLLWFIFFTFCIFLIIGVFIFLLFLAWFCFCVFFLRLSLFLKYRMSVVFLFLHRLHVILVVHRRFWAFVNWTIDNNHERFKGVFVERMHFWKVAEKEIKQSASVSSISIFIGNNVDFGFGFFSDFYLWLDFNTQLFWFFQVFYQFYVIQDITLSVIEFI